MSAAAPPLAKRWLHALVAVGFLVVFASSVIKATYQSYFVELAEHFGQGRSLFAWSASLFMLATGAMSPLVGALSDRLGALHTAAIGSLVGGMALIVPAWWSQSLVVFTVCYGLAGAFAVAAMTYVPMGVLVDRLFDGRKTGLAYAVITNGTAVGFIVLAPMMVWLHGVYRWTDVFLLAGLVLALPLATLVWVAARREPRGVPGVAGPNGASAWRTVRGDPWFYVLALSFFGCGATMAFIDVHLLPFWQGQGASRLSMSYGLSLLGTLELLSGLASGALAVRYDQRALLAGFYALRSLSMVLLLIPGWHVVPFAMVFGASYLGTVVLTSMLCLQRYGPGVKGRVFGLLFLVHQVGAFASVQLGALSFDRTGSYQVFIVALAVLTFAGGIAAWIGLRPTHAQPLPQRAAAG